jgi:hypothetical protein
MLNITKKGLKTITDAESSGMRKETLLVQLCDYDFHQEDVNFMNESGFDPLLEEHSIYIRNEKL